MAEALQLLEDQHLCIWGENAAMRESVCSSLITQLPKLEATQICRIDCSRVVDVESFCAELERALGADLRGEASSPIAPTLVGALGAVAALQTVPVGLDGRPVRRRFLLWHDAHTLLRLSADLFGRLVDTVLGSAMEAELHGEDVLLIQRSIFFGRASLDVYAEDPRGQFRSWYSEAGEVPLWRCVTGVDRPRLLSLPVAAFTVRDADKAA